jgi:cytochrome c oxidase subunit 3
MGLPITNAKLAMWLFLATEIMFFSGLIGAYIVLRFGTPPGFWPTPHDVHLAEWMGAVNTFVLICSSVSVVLALAALHDNQVSKAVWYILITLALAGVFLVIKAFEYNAKYQHGIIPGRVAERGLSGLDMASNQRNNEKLRLQAELNALPDSTSERAKAIGAEIKRLDGEIMAIQKMYQELSQAQLSRKEENKRYHELSQQHPELHLPEAIINGNLWASLYFTLTGIHALHVVGGMVIFVIMLLMAVLGRFGTAQTQFVELSGLYWHFVDIVWIFLFPLLYLIG